MTGNFSGWKENEKFRLERINPYGDWETYICLRSHLSTVIFINYQFTGKMDRENVYHHMPPG